MRSKLVKILFATVAAFVALCTQAATETVNGIEWKYMVTEEGTAVIGSGESDIPAINQSTSGAITIPSTLGGCPVVEIGDDAFCGCSSITSVTIPDSVTSIGDGAFYYGYELTSVTIPNSVTKIGEYAFYDCSSLENLIIPDSVTSIGWGAFYYCASITDVVMPSNITHIAGYIFSHCSSLENVTIPDSVTSIGEGAFYECSSLTNVTIPRSVDNIDIAVFSGCLSLENIVVDSGNAYYKSVDGLLLSKDGSEIIACPGGKTDVTIPDNVLSIGNDAFSWCELLANVIIAGSVTNINEYAFVGCSSLTNITIPCSVVNIGAGAFAWCESLEEVLFERDRYEINVDFMSAFRGTPWLTSGDAFPPSTNDSLADAKILSGKTGCVRGSNVSATSETIEEGLGLGSATVWWKWIAPFSANTEFYTIGSDIDTLLGIFVLKDGLLTKVAFDDDDRIVDFNANAGTTYYIGVSGYEEDQGFITLSWQQLIPPENDNFTDAITLSGKAGSVEGSNINATSETMDDSFGFGSATVWWKWTAPSSAIVEFDTFGSKFDTVLGVYILDDGSLTEVTFNDDDEYGEIEYGESRVRFNANAGTTYYIGVSGYEYEQHDILLNWDSLPEFECSVSDGGVTITEYNGSDSEVVIPATIEGKPVVSIGELAFYEYTSLRSITIPSSVTNIGDYAFEDCRELREVKGGENLARVGYDAFYGTLFLYGADSWDEVDEEDYYLGLDLVYVGNFIVGKRGWLEEAWNDEYYDEDGNWIWEYNLEIREGTTGIADGLFTYMPITSVTIPGSVKRISYDAFCYNELTGVTIAEGVEEIDVWAFYSNTSLTNIIIPSTVKRVGADAFGGCVSLSDVKFKSEDTVFDATAFRVSVPVGEPNEFGGYNEWYKTCATNLNPLVFEKVGYGLVGWKTKAVNGADATFEATFGATDLTPFASTNYYGKWVPDVNSGYTVYTNYWGYDEEDNWVELDVPEIYTNWNGEVWSGYDVIPVVEANRYMVAFDSNGGSAVESIDVAYGSAYGELPVSTRTGYTFTGWYNGEELVTSETVAGIGNQTLVAGWTVNRYSVTFDANGGSAVEGLEVTYGSAYGELPVSTRTGYTFTGWYNGEELVTTNTIAGVGNQTLVAGWTVNHYTVTFDANGGSAVEDLEVTYGSAYGELPVSTRTGYTFTGWYNGEELVTTNTIAGVGNQTLVAGWTVNRYSIVFNSNGGVGSMPNQVLAYDETGTLSVCTYNRSGYEFIGWALAPESGNIVYQNGAAVKGLAAVDGDIVELYAVWDRTSLWAPPVTGGGASGSGSPDGENPGAEEDAFTGVAAEVYDGYVCDGDVVIGTIQAKTAKAKNGTSKVTVTIQIAGEKKLTIKGDMSVEDAEFEAEAKDGRILTLGFGANGLFGDFDGYLIDGARNFFSSKDKSEKAGAEADLQSWLGTLNVECDDGILSVTVAKKGKVTVKGTYNGAKVSAKAQALIGADMICIPVIYSKKGVNLAFTVWLPIGGTEAEVVGLGDDAVIGMAGTLKEGAKFNIEGDIKELIPTAIDEIDGYTTLPQGESVSASGKKWVVADGAKAAKVAYKKGGGLSITEGKKGAGIANASGLKLTYKSKDGSFSGSFTVYALENNKLKKHKATVTGVLINGIGYGTATIKKLGSWAITIE